MRGNRSFLLPIVPFLFLSIGFELLVGRGTIPSFLVPAPSQVFKVFSEDFSMLLQAFLQTASAAGLGLAASIALGLLTALLLSLSSFIRQMFYPYAVFFQTVPLIAIAPILVIWLGYGLPTVIASAFIVSIFPVIANSVLGMLATDQNLLDLFRLFNANRIQTLLWLRLPYALPHILGGFKIAAGLAVIGAIVGEFISGGGLGGVIDIARNQQRIDRVFAAVILAAFLGIIFFSLISAINRTILKPRGNHDQNPS